MNIDKMIKKIDKEVDVEARLCDKVKRHGGMCIKLLSFHVTGLPDRMCLLPGGNVYFVELKTTGEKPRKSQVAIHNKFKRLGFPVMVIDSKKGVDDFIDKITK